MSRSFFRVAATGGVLFVASLGATACATKDFVREEVALVDARVAKVDGTAREALDRATSARKLAEGKFLYQVVLSDDSVKFPTDQHALSPEAEARLAELAQRLQGENRNVYLEIQGFTDSVGDDSYNEKLGEARAEAVRRYLNRSGVALNRMATISYGEDSPVASNDTPEGRAQNRRVTIVVLS